jgi:hypothetical protein
MRFESSAGGSQTCPYKNRAISYVGLMQMSAIRLTHEYQKTFRPLA